MAELPEIKRLARQMEEALRDKPIRRVEILQEKCTNVPPASWGERVRGASVQQVQNKGKWIVLALTGGESILLSLGMGADVFYHRTGEARPEKYQVRVELEDGSGFTARFWWFGSFLLVSRQELGEEPNTKNIAMDPLDARFTWEYFQSLAQGRRTQVKSFLLNQKLVGGIGNMYIHDILFLSRVHPQKKLCDLNEKEVEALYHSVRGQLEMSLNKGGFSREPDFYGEAGGYTEKDFLVGYRAGKPCPVCGEAVEQIKTGSTSSYLCPACQPLG